MKRLLVTLLALAMGCSGGGSGSMPDGHVEDAADAGADTADTGADAADGGDSGSDVRPRALVPMKLLGDSVENRVHSPNFDSASDLWHGYSSRSELELKRRTFALTPTGQPTLELPSSARYVLGQARGGPAPIEASIWVGVPVETQEAPELTPYILGLSLQQKRDVEYTLVADNDSTQVLGDLMWTRWHARIDEDLLGLAYFEIDLTASGMTYLTAPTLRTLDEPANSIAAMRASAPRVFGMAAAPERSARARQAFEDTQRRAAERAAASREPGRSRAAMD